MTFFYDICNIVCKKYGYKHQIVTWNLCQLQGVGFFVSEGCEVQIPKARESKKGIWMGERRLLMPAVLNLFGFIVALFVGMERLGDNWSVLNGALYQLLFPVSNQLKSDYSTQNY